MVLDDPKWVETVNKHLEGNIGYISFLVNRLRRIQWISGPEVHQTRVILSYLNRSQLEKYPDPFRCESGRIFLVSGIRFRAQLDQDRHRLCSKLPSVETYLAQARCYGSLFHSKDTPERVHPKKNSSVYSVIMTELKRAKQNIGWSDERLERRIVSKLYLYSGYVPQTFASFSQTKKVETVPSLHWILKSLDTKLNSISVLPTRYSISESTERASANSSDTEDESDLDLDWDEDSEWEALVPNTRKRR